jgi:hypothetical protein
VQALRWTGIATCAVLAGLSLVFGIVDLTRGWAGGTASKLGWAVLLGVSASLLWRRPGWRRAGAVFGLLILGFVVAWFVLVELHTHGYF